MLILLLTLSCKNEGAQKANVNTSASVVIDTVVPIDTLQVKPPVVTIIKDNLLDRMATRAQLSQFVLALSDSGLDSLLQTQSGPFTVFAVLNPSNMSAVKEWGKKDSLQWPASYIIDGAYSTPTIYKSFSSLRPQTTFTTLNEKQFTLFDRRDTLFIEFNQESPKAYLYSSDLQASNGIVHLIKFVGD